MMEEAAQVIYKPHFCSESLHKAGEGDDHM